MADELEVHTAECPEKNEARGSQVEECRQKGKTGQATILQPELQPDIGASSEGSYESLKAWL